MQTLNPYLAPILDAIDEFLNEFESTNEHQIIKHLQDNKVTPFEGFSLALSKDLFSAHFLCMHALYHLKNKYRLERNYLLSIESVRIQRMPYEELVKLNELTPNAIESTDPLESYYLDASHYFETQEDEINELLQSFWQKYTAQDEKKEALETLGLPINADAKMVKVQYLKLAQKYHPDKGGCAEMFGKIRHAKTVLDKVI